MKRSIPPRQGALLVSAILLSTAAGCAVTDTTGFVSPAPHEYAAPPVDFGKAKAVSASPTEIPEEYRAKKWGLAEVVDIALRNNPVTRAAWYDAKSAAARVGMADGAFYPRLSADATVSARFVHRDDTSLETRTNTFAPALNLSWLLLDFGGRVAAGESARLTLAAASFTQNKLIDDTVLATRRAYYLYFSSKALREARQKALERAQLALKTAEGRHEAGVATISDVLSARTALSQARLALDTIEGAIETTRGNLAVAMGFPANLKFDVEDAPETGAYPEMTVEVEKLIEEAIAKRPDILAARMQAGAAAASIAKAESDGMPTVGFTASTGLTWIDLNKEAETPNNMDRREDSWFAGITLSIPLFTGFSSTYNIERARADASGANERVKTLEQAAMSQVFTAFHTLRTASRKVRTADEMIVSAQSAEEVALGRYKEGVGTMLDLVTAQTSLADARMQAIAARWEWKTALAQLAHDTGKLDLAGQKVSK